MTKPTPTHYVIVHHLGGAEVFRGTRRYCRDVRASAILDGTAVSGVKPLFRPKEDKHAHHTA